MAESSTGSGSVQISFDGSTDLADLAKQLRLLADKIDPRETETLTAWHGGESVEIPRFAGHGVTEIGG